MVRHKPANKALKALIARGSALIKQPKIDLIKLADSLTQKERVELMLILQDKMNYND